MPPSDAEDVKAYETPWSGRHHRVTAEGCDAPQEMGAYHQASAVWSAMFIPT
jgi:hypothetical protein